MYFKCLLKNNNTRTATMREQKNGKEIEIDLPDRKSQQPSISQKNKTHSTFSIPSIKAIFRDIIAQVYPNLCLCCGKNHIHIQGILCLQCHLNLPKTGDHLNQKNLFTERLWGRLPFVSCAALYQYFKGSDTQQLIHRLKYQRHPEVGVALGEYYGRQLKSSPYFSDVECIVPVPLHPRKQRMRGYNQSAEFAKGLAKTMEIPYYPNGLVRNIFTKTQTQKTRFERYDNVLRVFEVGNRKKLEGKHILLVDDVLTTGATLEACGVALLELPSVRLSMSTIAIAVNK